MGAYFAGIDVGSATTKAVVTDDRGHLSGYAIRDTGLAGSQTAESVLTDALRAAGIDRARIAATVATGYGRATVPGVQKQVTEITCHAVGAARLFPEVRTVIDIGGQDSKVIHTEAGGRLVDFAMNDKCAAGTGRFLEVMAKRLEVPLDELGALALQAPQALAISSTCTVFAESEVVSLLAAGQPRDRIVRGLHQAIVNRVWALARTVGIHERVVLTGGVARNRGVVALLEEKLERPLLVPAEPQIVGAWGAALLAAKL